MTTDSPRAADRGTHPARILCPIDLSDFSHPALACAVALGSTYGADVTVLHVFATWLPATTRTSVEQAAEARAAIDRDLRLLVAPFNDSGVALRLRTVEGDAAAEIVRCARETDTDLIVMGTHGRSGFDRFALGSVAEKVVRKAACPVLTLPPGACRSPQTVTFTNILCPVDFSTDSERALDFAVSLAERTGGSVTVLHVVETLDGEQGLHGPEYIADIRRRQCQGAQAALHDMATAHARTVVVAEAVALGRPHVEILRVANARSADLIVIGVRGRGAVDLTLFGSTTNQVVRRATCPVLTIRSTARVDR